MGLFILPLGEFEEKLDFSSLLYLAVEFLDLKMI